MLFSQTSAFTLNEKISKNHIKIINSKYQLQHGMKNLNYLMDYILYKIFKVVLNVFKNIQKKTDDPSIRISVNKIENRITFKIKTGYYLKPLILEMMKLHGSIKNRITKDGNGENQPHLEITEIVFSTRFKIRLLIRFKILVYICS